MRCAKRRRGDGHSSEEPLISIAKPRALDELARELPAVIPFAPRQLGQSADQASCADRFDQRLPARHALRPALAVVAEEDLVAALSAQHDLHMLGGGAR